MIPETFLGLIRLYPTKLPWHFDTHRRAGLLIRRKSYMRKSLIWAALAIALSATSFAQDFTKAEVFGGYQYTRINLGNGVDGQNFNGWNAAAQYNWSKAFGIKADFSGAYKNVSGVSLRQHTFLFGPVLSARSDKATFFAHALFGGAHDTADTGSAFFGSASDTAFAMALGGG